MQHWQAIANKAHTFCRRLLSRTCITATCLPLPGLCTPQHLKMPILCADANPCTCAGPRGLNTGAVPSPAASPSPGTGASA